MCKKCSRVFFLSELMGNSLHMQRKVRVRAVSKDAVSLSHIEEGRMGDMEPSAPQGHILVAACPATSLSWCRVSLGTEHPGKVLLVFLSQFS